MPFRFKGGYSAPGAGTNYTKPSGKKVHVGPGPTPAGTKRIKAPKPRVVTTSPAGHVTTSGFPSPHAAVQAKQRTQASRRRVSRVEAEQASALAFHRRSQQRASQTTPQPSLAALSKRNAPMTTKTVISSKPLGRTDRRWGIATSSAAPSYKPPKFQGAKTAGTPSLKELQVASSSGKLRTNRKGFVTTPAVRKTAGTLKRLKSKARRSEGPLPGLTPQESHVAKTVLRQGQKSGATRKEKLAAAETGLVESGFQNLPGGDADSEGWRQERTSIYGTGPTGPRNVKASADRFYKELRTDPGAATAPTAGSAAQAAQGSAFPERYDEVKPEANAIVKAFERGGLKPAQERKLAQAQVKARKLGLNVVGASSLGPAPKRVVTRYKAARVAMKEIEGTPYVYGAGHGAIEANPSALDCSGAVSYVLAKAGVLKAPLTSGSMGSVLKPGPGAITVFYNAGHTFIWDAVKKEFWGTSVGDSGSGGLGPHPTPSEAYLAQYSVGHVPGLGKKQALQLGASGVPSAPTSFPGMTLSASGTTATVDPSATATRDKPGFSKSPIKLTPNQKAHRTLKKLAQLGAGVSQFPAEGIEDKGAILKSLERTYGKAAV